MNNSITSSNSNSNNNIIHRGGADELETFVMENCMMIFKTQAAAAAVAAAAQAATSGVSNNDIGRMYTCKTCGKKFHSFQALGGHRASHKKLKPVDTISADVSFPVKPKTHACSICGVEFPIGQALGGHMRRHRAVVPAVSTEHDVENSDGNNNIKTERADEKKRKIDDVSWLKRLSSNKRVCLDFNQNFSFESCVEKKEESHGDGEIIEDEEEDFLKLELRQPIRG
ncbi:hypothetical protein vseg_021105 [Gypsophila vaccaria]